MSITGAVNEMQQRELRKAAAEEFKKRKLVAEGVAEKLHASLKPAGYFNIPELLDQRRLEFGIPNGAFEVYPLFDQIYIWQISTVQGETFDPEGCIIMPDQTISRKRNTAPRGILISAGLQAMDSLHSTGCGIGHIVRFKKLSPYVMPVEEIDGHELTVMVIRDGDLNSSEDLAKSVYTNRTGEVKNIATDGSYDFRYVVNGQQTGPKIEAYYDRSI